jgi:UPF0716 family protein affecting phage T7 exclusion
MGAGMVLILVLVIIAAVIGALMFFGIGAGLWAKRTEPPESDGASAGPDLVDGEMTTTATPDEPPDSSRRGT